MIEAEINTEKIEHTLDKVRDYGASFFDAPEEELRTDSEFAAKVAADEEAKAKKEALSKARKERATAIDELLKKRKELDKEIQKALTEFTKDYGSYHTSYRNAEDLFDSFWDWFLIG